MPGPGLVAEFHLLHLDASARQDLAVQRAILAQVPEVERIVARVGSDELGLDPMGLNETDSFLVLADRKDWRRKDKAWLTEEIRKVAAQFPGVEATFTQPIEMRVSEMLTGSRGDLAVKVFGPDLKTLGDLAGRIEETLKTTRGASDVYTVAGDGVTYLQLDVDRAAAVRAGKRPMARSGKESPPVSASKPSDAQTPAGAWTSSGGSWFTSLLIVPRKS